MNIKKMPKRIKILFTIPNFETAGSGRVVYDLIKGLDTARFAPEICCFHDRGAYFEIIKTLEIPIHLFPFSAPYRPFMSLGKRIFQIYRFFKKHRFDLIHSWHWSSDFTEPLAAKLAGIPFVYTKKAMGWGNKSWVLRSKFSTKIIAINQDMLTDFFASMKEKVVKIPLGVDTSYFKPNTLFAHPSIRTNNTKEFIIVTVANLVAVKGIEILLDAVALLNDPQIKVVIVGDDQNAYGKNLKESYQTNLHVHFEGKQLDVRPYLALADVFVIPTKDEGRKEGMPIAPLEAMASGKIVIGSNISGIKDILKDKPTFLFHPNDPEDLSLKIKQIKDMDVDAKQLLETEFRQLVMDHFTIERFIKAHEALYLKMTT